MATVIKGLSSFFFRIKHSETGPNKNGQNMIMLALQLNKLVPIELKHLSQCVSGIR